MESADLKWVLKRLARKWDFMNIGSVPAIEEWQTLRSLQEYSEAVTRQE